VGGLAVQHHGVERLTEDIDLLISRVAYDELVQEGKIKFGQLKIMPGTQIDVLTEGKDRNPDPEFVRDADTVFPTFAGLIYLKLNAGRMKDVGDVAELLKAHGFDAVEKETILAFLPATWIAAIVETQTAGRVTPGDAQGTLWRGSAFIGGAASNNEAVTPLLPGRFSWQLSPMVLLGSLNVRLENAEALSQPVTVTGSWRQWQISPASVSLPAERLTALGAPLNTLQPAGRMQLSWMPLQLTSHDGALEITGAMTLAVTGLASRMSPVKPLGDYNLALDWQGARAAMTLKTMNGPLRLDGAGTFANGHWQFSGTAQAEAGQEEKLANFLNLLGQRRRDGDREIIALEFK
jgi:general secretion pathway protein N